MEGVVLPEGYTWDKGRGGHDRDEALGVMFQGIILSLCLVLLLMAALFESVSQPFAILIDAGNIVDRAGWSAFNALGNGRKGISSVIGLVDVRSTTSAMLVGRCLLGDRAGDT
jgi:multidrug efflux pump subunit AcrB